MIGLENSRHFLNQSDTKLSRLPVFALSSDWLLVIFPFVLIGRWDYFGFGFTTLNRKALHVTLKLDSLHATVQTVLKIHVIQFELFLYFISDKCL